MFQSTISNVFIDLLHSDLVHAMNRLYWAAAFNVNQIRLEEMVWSVLKLFLEMNLPCANGRSGRYKINRFHKMSRLLVSRFTSPMYIFFIYYLVGAWYVALWALPAKNGKWRLSNLSSMQSSRISLSTGVQRDIWYVCSVTRFFRGTWYGFLRFPCRNWTVLLLCDDQKFLYIITYISYNIHSQVAQISDHILISQIDLCMCEKFIKIFIGNSMFYHHI